MLIVHRVQETNTNTHTKNKNILLAASSAIVGTLMSFCYCSYRVQDAPKNLAFDRTKKKNYKKERKEGGSRRTMLIGTFN